MSLQRNETIVVRRHRPFNNSQVQSTEEDRKRWKEKTHRTEEPSQKTKRKKIVLVSSFPFSLRDRRETGRI